MDNKSFTDEDKEKFVEFLNFIARKAVFSDWTTADTVTHFKLLSHMQQQVLPKIDSHILEVIKIVEAEVEAEVEDSEQGNE